MNTPQSPLVTLARLAIETFLSENRIVEPGDNPAPEMRGQAGVFVSLHRRGNLRGCIGTFEPEQDSVAMETIVNAIRAATRDPRFPPVQLRELAGLDCKVDVLTPPEPVSGPGDLDPKHYGVIVRSGARRGLLLPDLEGVDSVAEQLAICRRKAGIGTLEPIALSRFCVTRYK